jgi:segregation and condensation protein B
MPAPLDDPLAGDDPAALERRFEERAARHLRALIEAALFASPEPVTVSQLARSLGEPEAHVQGLLEDLAAEYRQPTRGIFVRLVRGGFQLATKPEHDADLKELLRGFRPRAPLSRPALETLAIIAYRQPISAPQIQAIRRVEGAGVLQTLLKRKLIAPSGRRKDERHALLYKTTDLFLKDFGFQSLKDLPALEEFAEPRR